MALSTIHLFLCLLLLSSQLLPVRGNEEDEQSDAPTTQPSFLSQAGEHTVLKGRTVTLPCRVKDASKCGNNGEFTANFGDYAVSWSKVAPSSHTPTSNDQPYDIEQSGTLFVDRNRVTKDTRFEITTGEDEDDYALHITDVTGFDSGTYVCDISTEPALVQQQVLHVNVPPHVRIDPETNPYIVEPGHSLMMKCDAGGYPTPEVVWTREGGPLPDGRASHSHQQVAQLFYENATVNHAGIYHCKADNNVGDPARAQVSVQVYSTDRRQYAPSVLAERKFIPVKVGDTVRLSCNYSAYPPPQVKWIFNNFDVHSQSHKWGGRAVISSSKASVDRELFTTTVTIVDVQDSDFGEYLCHVANSLGTVEEVINISGKPGPPYLFTGVTREDGIDLSWHLESASNLSGYKLFYRKPRDNYSPWIDVPAEHGVRVHGYEWVVNYTWRFRNKKLEPAADYQLSVQGVNQYGDGSLPKYPLEFRTPAKLHDDDEGGHKDGHDRKSFDTPGEASKSTKSDDPHGAAAQFYSPGRIITAVLPILTLWLLSLSH